MLEPDEGLALCLVWHGVRQDIGIHDSPSHVEIAWDGDYELVGDFFRIGSEHPEIGVRMIAGYPLSEIRGVLEQVQSFDTRYDTIISRSDTVDMTPDVIAHLVKNGYEEARLLQMKEEGFRFSPSRNSLLSAPVSSDDDESKLALS